MGDVKVVDLSKDPIQEQGDNVSANEWVRQQNAISPEEKAVIKKSRSKKKAPEPKIAVDQKKDSKKEISELLKTCLRRFSDMQDVDAQLGIGENTDYVWCKSLIRSVIAKVEGINKDRVDERGV